jgi:hypothetical protein
MVSLLNTLECAGRAKRRRRFGLPVMENPKRGRAALAPALQIRSARIALMNKSTLFQEYVIRRAKMPSVTRSAVDRSCGNATIILILAAHLTNPIGWKECATGNWFQYGRHLFGCRCLTLSMRIGWIQPVYDHPFGSFSCSSVHFLRCR